MPWLLITTVCVPDDKIIAGKNRASFQSPSVNGIGLRRRRQHRDHQKQGEFGFHNSNPICSQNGLNRRKAGVNKIPAILKFR